MLKKLMIIPFVFLSINAKNIEINENINNCKIYLEESNKNLELASKSVGVDEKEFFGLLSSQTAILYQLKYNECKNQYRFIKLNNKKTIKEKNIKLNKKDYDNKSNLLQNVY